MPITVEEGVFENILEIWGIGHNTIEVITKNDRHFRICAARNLRSGSTGEYHANYEELIEVNENVRVFSVAYDMPRAIGDTIENCLHEGLGWVDDIGKSDGH